MFALLFYVADNNALGSIDHTCSNCAIDGQDINILYIWAPTGVEKINDKRYIGAEKIMFKTRIITVPIYNKTSIFSAARRRRSGATQVWGASDHPYAICIYLHLHGRFNET